jgi:putative membrane protein
MVAWLARLALRLVILAVIIGIVANIISGIHVTGGFGTLLWIAVLFSLVNLIVGPILTLLSLPLIVLTLGLFLIIINAALLAITAGLSSDLSIDNFWSALLGGILIAIFSWIAELLLPLRPRRR